MPLTPMKDLYHMGNVAIQVINTYEQEAKEEALEEYEALRRCEYNMMIREMKEKAINKENDWNGKLKEFRDKQAMLLRIKQ